MKKNILSSPASLCTIGTQTVKTALVLFLFSFSMLSCNNGDDDNGSANPNGFLQAGEKVFVKMKIDGVLWESTKTSGSAAYVGGSSNTISINAQGAGHVQIVHANASSTGTFTMPETGSQFVFADGAIQLIVNGNYTGTSLTMQVSDAIEYSGNTYSIKGTFSGTAFNTITDTFAEITEGEFYGGGLQ